MTDTHKAIIAKVVKTEPISGADRIHICYVLGEACITSREVGVGFEGVLFPEGLQLSEEFCKMNNLFRDSEKNYDNGKKGFFEENRRVRAQKMLGVKSEAFFSGKECLAFTGYDISSLREGDRFDELNGHKICKKYISEHTAKVKNDNKEKSAKAKMSTPLFKEHVDSVQFKHYASSIPVGALLTFTAKFHGTSQRLANTLVKRQPTGIKSIVNKACLSLTKGRYRMFKDAEQYELVAGTRRVVLRNEDREKHSFHGSENYRFQWLDKISPYLTPGLTVYSEIVGYANGKPIMSKHHTKALKDKKYTEKYGEEMVYKYGCPEGENDMYIYRITLTSPEGEAIDFTPSQVKKWCEVRGFKSVMEVWPPMIYDGDEERLREIVERLTEREDVLTEDYLDPSHVNEGIVVRADYDNTTPLFYKSKSMAFKICEGIASIQEVDMEDAS